MITIFRERVERQYNARMVIVPLNPPLIQGLLSAYVVGAYASPLLAVVPLLACVAFRSISTTRTYVYACIYIYMHIFAYAYIHISDIIYT